MTTMYEISSNMEHLLEMYTEALDCNDTEEIETIKDALEMTEFNFKEKALSYAKFIRQEDSSIEAIEAEIKRLQALKKSKENTVSFLKGRLSEAMKTFGFDKYDLGIFKLSFRKSESIVVDMELLPEGYTKTTTTIEPLKTQIKYMIKEGVQIPGAFIKENLSLQVK